MCHLAPPWSQHFFSLFTPSTQRLYVSSSPSSLTLYALYIYHDRSPGLSVEPIFCPHSSSYWPSSWPKGTSALIILNRNHSRMRGTIMIRLSSIALTCAGRGYMLCPCHHGHHYPPHHDHDHHLAPQVLGKGGSGHHDGLAWHSQQGDWRHESSNCGQLATFVFFRHSSIFHRDQKWQKNEQISAPFLTQCPFHPMPWSQGSRS